MKKGIALLLCACLLLGFAGCTSKVEATDNVSAEILHEIGILKGTENGLELERNVTRAEALVLVCRICGVTAEQQAGTAFADIDGHWAQDTIADAHKKGYVAGISETAFAPERTVTGREFVKMLLSVLGYDGITIENAYDKGIELSLLLHRDTKAAVQADAVLTRGLVATICHGALLVKTPEGKLVKQMLVEKGLYTEEDFAPMTCGGVPPAPTNFTDKLFMQLPKNENFMFSPFSIKMAFALAANGAEGETKQEILDVLEIEDLDAFNAAAAEQIQKYNATEAVELNIANALWINQSKTPAKVVPGYAQAMQRYYAAEIDTVTDKTAVPTINGWVSEKTKGKIPALIQNSDFYAALVNAVYFKADWENKFNKEGTREATFYNADGTTKKTDFMYQTDNFAYGTVGGVRILELPYKNYTTVRDENGKYNTVYADGVDVRMYILLSDTKVYNPQAPLDEATLTQKRVNLALPKFEASFEVGLNDLLKPLGIVRAFDINRAQMSGILENQPLYIQTGIHKSYIKVDEQGTEAAAVTGAFGGAPTSAPPQEIIEFKADHPFTYVIRDNASGEILFVGVYAQAK